MIFEGDDAVDDHAQKQPADEQHHERARDHARHEHLVFAVEVDEHGKPHQIERGDDEVDERQDARRVRRAGEQVGEPLVGKPSLAGDLQTARDERHDNEGGDQAVDAQDTGAPAVLGEELLAFLFGQARSKCRGVPLDTAMLSAVDGVLRRCAIRCPI